MFKPWSYSQLRHQSWLSVVLLELVVVIGVRTAGKGFGGRPYIPADSIKSDAGLSATNATNIGVRQLRVGGESRYGFMTTSSIMNYTRAMTNKDLFDNTCRPQHCLHHLLPPAVWSLDNLRDRGHSFNLSDYSTTTLKKSFVIRSLYELI